MKSRFYTLALTGLIICLGMAVSSANPSAWFGEPVSEQDGWEQSSWFGWYRGEYAPFVFHANHGWLYIQPAGTWLWIWDYGVNEWFATASGSYPLMYEPIGGNWMWYYEGTMGPRWYAEFSSGTYYKEFSGVLMPEEMEGMLSGMMDATQQADNGELQEQMNQIMEVVTVIMESGPSGTTCPVIFMDPEEVSLENGLPPAIFLSIDFGDGCEPVPDMGVIAGSLVLDVTNLLMTETGISLDLSLEADGLSIDGISLLDGLFTATAVLGVTMSESSTSTHWVTETRIEIDLDMNLGLTAAGEVLSGDFTVDGLFIETEYENSTDWNDVTTLNSGEMTLGMTNVVAGEDTVSSGNISLNVSEDGNGLLEMLFLTNQGEMSMDLTLETSEDGNAMTINTVGPASMAGYGLSISNLVMDSTQCENYPVSGIVTALYQGATYTLTVGENCDGQFTIQKQ